MKTIYRHLFEVLPAGDRWKWLLMAAGMTLMAFLEMLGVGLIPLFLAALATQGAETITPGSPQNLFWNLAAFAGITEREQLFPFGLALLVLFFLLKNAYVLTYIVAESRYTWNRYTYVGTRLLNAYVRAPFTFHRQTHSGLLQKNIAEESRYFVENLLTSSLQILRNSLVIGVIGLMLFLVEPWITLGAIVLIGGGAAGLLVFLKKQMTGQGVEAHHARLSILRTTGDLFSGIRELQVLGRTHWFRGWAEEQIRRFSKAQSSFMIAQNSNKPIIETVAVFGIVGVSLAMWMQGRPLVEIAPTLALFGIATVRLLPEVRLLIGNVNTVRYFKETMIPVRRDLKLLGCDAPEMTVFDSTLDTTSSSDGVTVRSSVVRKMVFSGQAVSDREPMNEPKVWSYAGSPVRITLRNVSYSYPDGEDPVLQQLDWQLQPGTIAGLTGASGSGKSTLVDLLMGLLEPIEGEIFVDNMLLQTWLDTNPGGVGYIPQAIFLADDSLRRNIALGLPDQEIDDDRVWQCLKDAQLDTFVKSLPEGLETVTGEDGVRLSGGQRQRIGIARALYHQPGFIVMDEGTSALDAQTENDVLEAIDPLRGRCTILIISHRESGLRICDDQWVLDNQSMTHKSVTI